MRWQTTNSITTANGSKKKPAVLSSAEVELLQFMFDKRLELFNVRREHEWKIQLSVIGALAAVDYAIISKAIHLTDGAIEFWHFLIALIFFVTMVYQLGVQRRNRVDRIIMDEINTKLCNHLKEHKFCKTRIPVDVDNESERNVESRHWSNFTFLWAFFCQAIILFLICSVSWVVPRLVREGKIKVTIVDEHTGMHTVVDSSSAATAFPRG